MTLINPLIYTKEHGCVTSLHWILFSSSYANFGLGTKRHKLKSHYL